MKFYNYYIVIVASLVHIALSQDPSDFEVCDVEGSGIEDCPSDNHCCKQSLCDNIFNPNQNPDKKCCTKAEWEENPKRSDCIRCTECCDETERKQIPQPDHCSHCRKCEEGINYVSLNKLNEQNFQY